MTWVVHGTLRVVCCLAMMLSNMVLFVVRSICMPVTASVSPNAPTLPNPADVLVTSQVPW